MANTNNILNIYIVINIYEPDVPKTMRVIRIPVTLIIITLH